ncbi:MAG: hypothetical protein J1E34_02425 [Oscillospiraceae bacterium]|nr:hypothetical protein [Oscillospiraceae bacterium]
MRNIIKLSDQWQKEEAKEVFSSFELPFKTPAINAPEKITLRRKIFISDEDKNEEFFLEIKGLSGKITVFIGNEEAGKETCAIAPRYIDITGFIKKGEDLEIRLEIIPLPNPHGDFTFFDSSVICVPRSHFDVKMNNDPISVRTEFEKTGVKLFIKADIINPNNYDVVVFKLISPLSQLIEVRSARPTDGSAEFFIEEPLRWDGVHSAYKYRAEIILQRDSEIIDTASKSFGIREFKAEKDGFFKLNGIKLPLGGCALRNADKTEKDAESLKELDANLVLVNYIDPEERLLNKCDELGIMVFFLFSGNGNDSDFDELKRITRLLSCHPSAAFISHSGYDPVYRKKICSEIKSNSQYIYTAGPCDILNKESLSDAIPDVLLLYIDSPAEKSGYTELESSYSEIISEHPDYRFAVFPKVSLKKDENNYQENFSDFHERMWSIFGTKKNTVCYFTGFLTDNPENSDLTGLISSNREKKDAFWFYKAQFSADKFIKIASLPEASTKKRITVKCYTNSSLPVLSVNGKVKKKLLPVKLSPCVYLFQNVKLRRKENGISLSCGNKTDKVSVYRSRSKKKK